MHHKWFNKEELSKVSECNSSNSCKEAINTALERNPQDVLHAFYKSLCATQGCGGATLHDVVAGVVVKIMKDGEYAYYSACRASSDLLVIGSVVWLVSNVQY